MSNGIMQRPPIAAVATEAGARYDALLARRRQEQIKAEARLDAALDLDAKKAPGGYFVATLGERAISDLVEAGVRVSYEPGGAGKHRMLLVTPEDPAAEPLAPRPAVLVERASDGGLVVRSGLKTAQGLEPGRNSFSVFIPYSAEPEERVLSLWKALSIALLG